MHKLGAMWKKDPGLVVSGGAHVLAFLLLVSNFSWAHKLDEQVESVPVEMVTSSDFNQIMNGEKTAKQMPEAQRRVDQVAQLEDKKSEPPIPESKKDTPPPPTPEKAEKDPGHDEKPMQEANAPPPPPTPPKPPEPVTPPPPVPTPPERPVENTEAAPKTETTKTETAKAEPEKPPPEEAEAIEPKPLPKPRPKIEAKKPPKKIAKLQPKKPVPPVKPVREAKEVPDPPPKPVPPKPVPPDPSLKDRALDQVAKLLDTMKPPKAEVKPKSGNEVKEAKRSEFSLDKIATLLDHDTPQRTASKGQKLTQLASLGSPTAHAQKMTPTLMAQIDGWLIDHYRGCWSYFGLGASTDYVPKIHVVLSRDGSLMARPVLVNQPSDANLRSLADSAMRAVNKCNPMPIPDWFKAHYEHWRDRTVRFDPKEMS